jgi:signal transduction histidine kinase
MMRWNILQGRLPLPRPLRTTSFRLTLLYAGTFTASGLTLFAMIIWFATRFMAQQIDLTVGNELAEIQADAAGKGPQGVRQVVETMAAHSPGIYYLLQDARGTVLAGNMEALNPVPGPRQLSWEHRSQERNVVGLRGRGVILPDGDYLFVGLSNFELAEMQEMIARIFLWGAAATILLALGGGFVMSVNVLRRIEIISQTSRQIISGDLDQRIALRGTNDEFDHLAASLNAMLDRIQELMSGLQQVSSDIAHDLRTPLARLRQKLEAGRRRELGLDELRQVLDGAIVDADVILGTFGALLRIAQIEASTRRSGFAPLDLTGVIGRLVDAYQIVAEANGQALTQQVESSLVLRGDEELLMQLLANLIENAITHTPSGTAIGISAEKALGHSPPAVKVTVGDTGPGIPRAAYRDVLQRFYRLETSRTSPGSGLGLSLVKAVAILHRAEFRFEDNAPGLRCVLYLPIDGDAGED